MFVFFVLSSILLLPNMTHENISRKATKMQAEYNPLGLQAEIRHSWY